MIFFFSYSLTLAQELTPKTKDKKEETVTSSSDTTLTGSTSMLLVKKKDKKDKSIQIDNDGTVVESDEDDDEEMPDTSKAYQDYLRSQWIPNPRIEAYVGYEAYFQPNRDLLNGWGYWSSFVFRQPQNPKNLRTTIGGKVQFAHYETDSKHNSLDASAFHSVTTEYSISLELAKVSKKRIKQKAGPKDYFHSFVGSIGLQESVDEGSQGDYSRQQIDLSIIASWYMDLDRNKRSYFSGTEFSGFYRYVVNTQVQSLYKGMEVPSQVYNKKMLNCMLDQTWWRFDLDDISEKVTLNVGTAFGYTHYSQNKEDWYFLALSGKVFWKHCRVLNAMVGIDFLATGQKITRVKVNADLFQFGRSINVF